MVQKCLDATCMLAMAMEGGLPTRTTSLSRYVVLVGSCLVAVGCDACQSSSKAPGVATESQETAVEQPIDSHPTAVDRSELEYDKKAYERLTTFLETDRSGMRIDDFLAEVGMETTKYTDLQSPRLPEGTRERLYHFDGFYMIISVDCILSRDTYTDEQLAELHERNEVVIGYMLPVVRIDGIRDPKKRVRASERIRNARQMN